MPKPDKFGFTPQPALRKRLAKWKLAADDCSPEANRDRSMWAEAAARYFADLTGLDWDADEPETAISDLLADLMHLADSLSLDFDSMIYRARNHYDEETAESEAENAS